MHHQFQDSLDTSPDSDADPSDESSEGEDADPNDKSSDDEDTSADSENESSEDDDNDSDDDSSESQPTNKGLEAETSWPESLRRIEENQPQKCGWKMKKEPKIFIIHVNCSHGFQLFAYQILLRWAYCNLTSKTCLSS